MPLTYWLYTYYIAIASHEKRKIPNIDSVLRPVATLGPVSPQRTSHPARPRCLRCRVAGTRLQGGEAFYTTLQAWTSLHILLNFRPQLSHWNGCKCCTSSALLRPRLCLNVCDWKPVAGHFDSGLAPLRHEMPWLRGHLAL